MFGKAEVRVCHGSTIEQVKVGVAIVIGEQIRVSVDNAPVPHGHVETKAVPDMVDEIEAGFERVEGRRNRLGERHRVRNEVLILARVGDAPMVEYQ